MSSRIGIRHIMASLMLLPSLDLAAQQAAALGPIERVSIRGGEISVLGQSFRITEATKFSAASQLAPHQNAVLGRHFAEQQVLVTGTRSSDGVLTATSVRALSTRYVPGSSEVFIQGAVSEVDRALAVVSINNLKIYIGDIVSTPGFNPSVGTELAVLGIQTVSGGVVWALGVQPSTRIKDPAGPNTNLTVRDSITGTGKLSIT